MTMTKRLERLIAEMEMHGYWFDVWESYHGRLIFRYTGATFPLEFSSTRELAEWLENVDF